MLAGMQLLVLLAGAPGLPTGLAGVTRAAEDGRPISGVLIEQIGSDLWVRSDSLGRYAFAGLAAGRYRMRFTRAGRTPVEITTLIPEGSVVQLDVELSQQPAELAPLVVNGHRDQASAGQEEVGVVHLGPEWQNASIPGPVEVQTVLAQLPGVETRGENSGTLIFQGGESDQAGILIDGFPALNATHFGATLSAVNPDIVRGVEVRVGAPPARFGGWLSGTVLLKSSLLTPDAGHGTTGFNPEDFRQSFRGTLPGGEGQFLLSGRRSFRNILGDPSLSESESESESGNGYQDWLATVALPTKKGDFQLILLKSRNRLGFPSRLEGPDAAGSTLTPGLAAPANILGWRTGTIGAVWHGGLSGQGTLGVRAWRANTGSTLAWQSPNSPLALDTRFSEVAVTADGYWPLSNGSLEFGVGLTNRQSTFSSGLPGTSPSLVVTGHSTILTGYLERAFRLNRATAIRAGVRTNFITAGWLGFEPRVGLTFSPVPWLRASVDGGRIYQFTQSFRNQESLLSSIVAFELPAVTGTANLPIASADNFSVTVEATPSAGTTIGFHGFLRGFHGLLLGAASTPQPFLTGGATSGSGTATGAELRLAHRRGPLSVVTAVSVGSAARGVGSGVGYQPGFLRSGAVSMQVGLALDRVTRLGLAFRAGSGRPTTLVREVDWRPYDPLRGGEFLGTPDNLDAGINQRRLPGSTRVDLGVSRRWRAPWGGARGQLTTSASIENLFGRPNPIALIANGALGIPRSLFAQPRTLRLELTWGF